MPCENSNVNREWMNVLVAVVGMTPAVLTEAVWALVHCEEPIVPDEVVVITTVPGQRALTKVLLEGGEWNGMLEELSNEGALELKSPRFGKANDHIRLLPSFDGNENIADIRQPENSSAAADFIMKTLREFTENPETRVGDRFDRGWPQDDERIDDVLHVVARTRTGSHLPCACQFSL